MAQVANEQAIPANLAQNIRTSFLSKDIQQ